MGSPRKLKLPIRTAANRESFIYSARRRTRETVLHGPNPRFRVLSDACDVFLFFHDTFLWRTNGKLIKNSVRGKMKNRHNSAEYAVWCSVFWDTFQIFPFFLQIFPFFLHIFPFFLQIFPYFVHIFPFFVHFCRNYRTGTGWSFHCTFTCVVIVQSITFCFANKVSTHA